MKSWTVEPRDPLVVRDGRPPVAGMPSSRSLDFPWPSTVAGLARTRAGQGEDGVFDVGRIDALLQESVRGPWLVELNDAGAPSSTWLPAPADAVCYGENEFLQLVPEPFEPDVQSNLRQGLMPVRLREARPAGKPGASPAFWAWAAVERWLLGAGKPGTGETLSALPHERRFHVAIDKEMGTALDGKLFVSDGLRFGGARRLALGFATSEGLGLEPGPVKLGGEGRPSWLRAADGALPAPPSALVASLEKHRRARVLLTTPGIFDGGALPSSGKLFGAPIVAACVGRPQVISGWDHRMAAPRASRRMVAAGSVFWVDLTSVSDVGQWLADAWAQPVPEQLEQDRRDGFGLAFVGVGI